MSSQEEINKIFQKWEEYLEYVPAGNNIEEPPVYTPTPITAGPIPLTIEEYKIRQIKKKKETTMQITTPKKRGGRKRHFQKECHELQNIINISKGEQKGKLINKLKKLKEQGWKNF